MLKKLRKPLIGAFLLAPLLLGNSGCPNAFTESANKTSSAALLFEARMKIDERKWDAALLALSKMTTADRNTREVRVTEASAYAGRCGLDLIRMAKSIADDISTQTLMPLLLNSMSSATSYADCTAAEARVTGITPSEITRDDWVFLAFIEFARMGAILQTAGASVGSFNPCSMNRTQATDMGASLNQALGAIASSGVSIAGSVTATLAGLCSQGYPCSKTTGFSDPELAAILTLVNTNNIGLGSCGGPFPTTLPDACACLPPP